MIILLFSVKALAKRIALKTASVPEFTKRTLSIPGKALQTIFASLISFSVDAPKVYPFFKAFLTAFSTILFLCPNIIGPYDKTRSIYSLPSTSNILLPFAFSINNGTPPTDLKALTGELTAPTKCFCPFVYNSIDFSKFIFLVFWYQVFWYRFLPTQE